MIEFEPIAVPALCLGLTLTRRQRAVTPGHLSGSNYNVTVVALSTDPMEGGGVWNNIILVSLIISVKDAINYSNVLIA